MIDQPTATDLARDLEADLTELSRLCAQWPEWVGGTMRESDLAIFARMACGAALRRAAAAEAQIERLRKAGDAVLYHLERNTNDPLANPRYYEMLAQRLREAGFEPKGVGV